ADPRRRASPAGGLEFVGHQDRVDVVVTAPVVTATVSLLHEAEVLVELDRSLVVRKDVQLELADLGVTGPVEGRLEQPGADAAAGGSARRMIIRRRLRRRLAWDRPRQRVGRRRT